MKASVDMQRDLDAVHNRDIAATFEELADLLEVEGENPFRIRAYRNAARTIDGLGHTLAKLVEQGEDLTALQGVGKDLAAKIEHMVRHGTLPALMELRDKLPPDITLMLKLPGLGPKRVRAIYRDLKIETLPDLEAAAKAGRIRALSGFGPKLEQRILKAAVRLAETPTRFMRSAMQPEMDALVEHLGEVPGVQRVEAAGSYRRWKETVGDLDLIAVAADSAGAMQAFVNYGRVKEVLAQGPTKSSLLLTSGIQVDFRVVDEASFGAAMLYFTGSKEHNVQLRKRAQKRDMRLNEYGLHRGDEVVAGDSEEAVFDALDLAYVCPELREGRGEIEAAERRDLPSLVRLTDVRGDLHAHTTASDGRATLEQMAEAAITCGYDYLAITEHSKRLTIANGLDEDRLRRQVEEIDRLNEQLKDFTLLKGIEVDILEEGALDLSSEVLRLLDLVVGSVHSRFNLSVDKQTERIIRAMEHPCFTLLGHPTGRLVLERDPYEVDMERIIACAQERGCYLELNANPHRLDLTDVHCRMAREAGVLVSIDTDAHRTANLSYMDDGVGQARRGWLTRDDVLNTRSLEDLRPLLARTMSG